MKPQQRRRWKAVLINPDALISCFVTRGDGDWTHKLISPELPEDIRVHSVSYDNLYMGFRVILEHDSFPEVPEWEPIPVIQLEFQEVRMQRYRAFDVTRSPDPVTQTQSIQRNEDGTIKEHICTLGTWYDSEEKQMKRYGITGWDDKGVAIWEKGRGPRDGTIVVRTAEYRKHNFQHKLSGIWTSVGDEFFKQKPETTNSAIETFDDGLVKVHYWERPITVSNGESIRINGDRVEHLRSDGTVIESQPILERKTASGNNGTLITPANAFKLEKPPIEDPFMKIWREKENQ